jgi:hypothetical protein
MLTRLAYSIRPATTTIYFFCKFFDTLRMDLWIRDNQGFNPLERAVHNLSYDFVYYLAMYRAHEENLLTIASLELTNSNSVR